MNELILDHQENVRLNLDSFPLRNIQGLHALKYGIYMSAKAIRDIEMQYNQDAFKNKGRTCVMDIDFEMNHKTMSAYNSCNWFSVNFVSYFRVITMLKLTDQNNWKAEDIKNNGKRIAQETRKLLENIAPDVLLHRNKVAAHLAMSDPRSEDSVATLLGSLTNQVGFTFPYYSVTFQVHSQGTSSLPNWNLTQIYEDLTERFWPEHPIPSLPLKSQKELNNFKAKFETT